MDSLAIDSHVGIGFGFLDVGDDRGGVTGALFDILRGGRDREALRMYGMRFDTLSLSTSNRNGLGKEDEEGLTWYEGIGLGYDEEKGLGLCEEQKGMFLIELPAPLARGGLQPLRYVVPSSSTHQPASAQSALRTSLLSQCFGKL